MLEKIKELRVKAECAKALLALADDESEKRHFKKLLDKYKQELLKFLDEPQPKPSRSEQNEPNHSPSIPQSSKRSQIALKCVFFVKIRKKQQKGKK